MHIFKRKLKPGWLAIAVEAEALAVAHACVGGDGRPCLTLCAEHRKAGDDAEALARLGRALQLDRYHCTTCLPFGQYQFMQTDPPAVPPEELREAIRWRIKSLVDYPVEQATLDLVDVPGDPAGAARNRSVFVAVAPNAVIEKHMQLFERAEVPLAAIDVPELVQRNLARLFEPAGRGVAMLTFARDGGLLTFSFSGELYSTRRLDITADAVTEDNDEMRYQVFERVLLEMQRSIDNFEHQFHFISLAKLLIAPLPKANGLVEYLGANLYLPVEAVDLASVADLSACPDLAAAPMQWRFLTLIGSALRDEAGAAA